MTNRSYGQYCTMARALDVLGDRWTILVLRELFLGADRFAEIQRNLPGCSPGLLSGRLRGLVAAGLVTRTDDGYALTARGRDAEPVLLALGRFGVGELGPVGDDLLVPHTTPLAVRTLLRTEVLPARAMRVHLRLDEGDYTLRVARRQAGKPEAARVTVEPGVQGAPDVVVRGNLGGLLLARRGRRGLRLEGTPWAVPVVEALFSPS